MTEARSETAQEIVAPLPEQLQVRIQGFLSDERLETVRLASNTPQQETDERIMQALESLGIETEDAKTERDKRSSFLREYDVRRTVHPLRKPRNPVSFARLIKEVELDGDRTRKVEWRLERPEIIPASPIEYWLGEISRTLRGR